MLALVTDGTRTTLTRARSRPNGWSLAINGDTQSFVDLDDPTYMQYKYLQVLAQATVHMMTEINMFDALLTIGGGILSVPRFVHSHFPATNQTVVEASADVIALMEENMPTPPNITVANDYGETWIAAHQGNRFSGVVLDAFVGNDVPPAMQSSQFYNDVAGLVGTYGWVTQNVITPAHLATVHRIDGWASEHFTSGYVLGGAKTLNGDSEWANVVMVMSQYPLDDHSVEALSATTGWKVRRRW